MVIKKAQMKKIGKVLVSPPKMGIIQRLDKAKTESFSELQKKLMQTPGTLNYHLLILERENLVEKTAKGYRLTEEGKRLAKIIKDIASKETSKLQSP